MLTPAEIWTNAHRAICSITHVSKGQRVAQGTGFLVRDWLITNNHVVQSAGTTHVRVQFVSENGYSVTSTREFSSGEFRALLVDGDPESSWDFAILRADDSEFRRQGALAVSAEPLGPIGSPVAFLGFQFEDQNLSIGSGLLSSRYQRAGVDYLQLDASVNHGHSGGPLIDAESGQVVGLVTRKATGLTKQFDELIASFDVNIAALQQSQAIMRVGNIDPIEGFRITQEQLKRISNEIKRSANVGIGYAYDISRVRSALDKLRDHAP